MDSHRDSCRAFCSSTERRQLTRLAALALSVASVRLQAGQSEKKRSQNAVTTVQLYRQIIMALYGGYIALRVVWFWNSFTFGIFFGALFFSALNYFCLGAVQQALELGTSVSGAQDVLFVNWAVMVLSILSDKAFYLYLSIPAYLLYQYGPMIKNYLMPPQQPVVSGTSHTSRDLAHKCRVSERKGEL